MQIIEAEIFFSFNIPVGILKIVPGNQKNMMRDKVAYGCEVFQEPIIYLLMLNNETAKKFVEEWITAFNSHSIGLILEHYANEIEFYSPFIPLLQFNPEGVIRNKADLKRYFETGLNAYPALHFELHKYFTGINTIVIYYTSVNNRLAAETFLLNDEARAVKVFCNYHTDA